MSIIMSNIFPLQKIKGLGPMRIDFAPPTEKDKMWAVEISGDINGVRFHYIAQDTTASWLQEKILRYLESLV